MKHTITLLLPVALFCVEGVLTGQEEKPVKQPEKTFSEWMEIKAESGSGEVQYFLGLIVLGRGVLGKIKNPEKAVNQGIVDAQVKVGSCYLMGEGVDQNREKAYA